jgi:hypothetical protein
MGQRHSEYQRDVDDFYCEPREVVRALFDHAHGFSFRILHDPCCGLGTIVDVAQSYGFEATGADIVDRAEGRFSVRDFREDATKYCNIVLNPPYRHAADFVERALSRNLIRGGRIAILVPIGFLASSDVIRSSIDSN